MELRRSHRALAGALMLVALPVDLATQSQPVGHRFDRTGIRPLTDVTLAEAVKYGEAREQFGNWLASMSELWGSASVDPMAARHIRESPFDVIVDTPYMRAAMAVQAARRRSAPVPALSLATLNAGRVVVKVRPVEDPGLADGIETLVIRRAGAIIRPMKSTVNLATRRNAAGAPVRTTEGSFVFDFDAVAPTAEIVLVLVGSRADFEWPLSVVDLTLLR